MRLSVVVPALDEAERIAETVASAATEGVEVLVVDGGSCDGTADKARAAGAAVVESPPGRARQLGVGVEATRGDVVLFLHADTRLSPGWDRAVRAALSEPETVGGAFRLRFDDREWWARVLEWGVRLRVAVLGLPYGDQALFVRRDALESMGGVPEAAFMEDLDLVRAMKRRGRLVGLPLAVSTSARRYRQRGPLRTVARNQLALLGWWFGLDRGRLREWCGR